LSFSAGLIQAGKRFFQKKMAGDLHISKKALL